MPMENKLKYYVNKKKSGGNRLLIVHVDGTEEQINSIPNLRIEFTGKNSVIKIHEPFRLKKGHFVLGEGGYIELGAGSIIRINLYIDAKAPNVTVKFGKKANIGVASILAGDEEGTEVIVGDEFLTSTDLYMRTADGHTIYDIETKRILNRPKFGIHIGNHVWCGYGVTILKDADIPENCVLGACSVVGKASFVPNSIIAGIPAKTVRTNVMWDSRNIDKYCRAINR